MKLHRPREWSLRSRLVSAVVLLLVVGMGVQIAGVHGAMKNYLIRRIDKQMNTLGRTVNAYSLTFPAGQPPDFGADAEDDFDSNEDIARSGELAAYVEVRDVQNVITQAFLITRDASPPRIPADLPLGAGGVSYFTARSEDGDTQWRVRTSRLPENRGYLVLAQPLTSMNAILDELAQQGIGIGVLVLAGACVLGWWLVRRGMRPLSEIGQTARAIGSGDLSRRVEPANDRTEVGKLGTALNAMLAQLEKAFAQRTESQAQLRRFVADASHELRTPLTSIRGYAEMFHRGAAHNPDDLALAMRRIESESARMAALVDELLLLARLDEETDLAQRVSEPIDIGPLVADAVADARAAEPDRLIGASGLTHARVLGDEAQLRQVLANLLANVRTHTPAGAAVTVTISAAQAGVRIAVRDSGAGLTPQQQERVFERFYRVDKSRARESGGAGLGLPIVAAIVQAHGGQVGVESDGINGSTFWFLIPAAD